jgi:hypothetical protein
MRTCGARRSSFAGFLRGTAMIRWERRVTGLRFRCIVAGERGAVEYVTLAGFPLAISCHSPQPLDGVRLVPCDVLEGPCYGDGTVLGARELCARWRVAGKDEEVTWRALEERYSRWA